MIKIIGISGAARSGKDTTADYLTGGYNFHKFSFAEPIKNAMKAAFGFTEDHVNGHLKEVVLEDLGVSPRFLMQTFGTEWGRKIVHTDVWLIAAQRKLNLLQEQLVDYVVIPDVRFENEAKFIREMGGVILHITRPDCEEVLKHESESGIALKPDDYQLANNGSLIELCFKIDNLMQDELQWS